MVEDQLQRMTESNRRLVNVASAHLNSQQLEQNRRQLEQSTTAARSVVGFMNGQQERRGDREAAVPAPPASP
jgi:hypothetical protein